MKFDSPSPGHSTLGSPEPQAGLSSLSQPITCAEYQNQAHDDVSLDRIKKAAAQISKAEIEEELSNPNITYCNPTIPMEDNSKLCKKAKPAIPMEDEAATISNEDTEMKEVTMMVQSSKIAHHST